MTPQPPPTYKGRLQIAGSALVLAGVLVVSMNARSEASQDSLRESSA